MNVETETNMVTARAEKGARTCVGCGEADERVALIRLVLSDSHDAAEDAPKEVVVDAAGGAFGRGVHVHARPDCLARAAKTGLARSLRTAIKVDPKVLATDIEAALARRATGLLSAAKRARKVAVGADATVDALNAQRAVFVVVATDAAHAAGLGPVQAAITEGRAAAWLDRVALGALFNRAEVAVCAVLDGRIGAELIHACQARASVGSLGQDSRGEACRSREVR